MVKHIKHPIYRTLFILILITLVAVVAIAYGRGYRISKDETGRNIVAGTGLLVLTSTPDGARAFVDGELATATDNTINLKPGSYNVRIEKDGYFAWEKEIEIKNEQVTETGALLFPKAPQLTSLTTTGIKNPVTDRERQLIAYTVSSASADLKGVYVMNLDRGLLPIGDSKKQITSNLIDNFSDSTLEISPDGSQILATISPEGSGSARTYLLETAGFNSSPLLVTSTAESIREDWMLEEEEIMSAKIRALNSRARNLVNTYFSNPIFSPEEDKVLYVASISAQLPPVITPQIPSTNSTPEARNITEGNLYIYNIKDDRNYLLKERSENPFPEFLWHPQGNHLLYVENSRINSIEYDGKNNTTVYAGPFLNNFITPWIDGSGIVILTSFNDPSFPPNLYRVVFR